MPLIDAKDLHDETDAVLNEVSKGKSFNIARNGTVIGTLQPVSTRRGADWKNIMREVWSAQREAPGKTRNPVLEERERRRR
jgi:antitoxin (DNA-binding transcriptional repressor) of toxin-antitoxin stability system